MGLVLNRPTETTVADAAPELEPLTGPYERVYQGGPVQPRAVVVLAEFAGPGAAAHRRHGRHRLRPRRRRPRRAGIETRRGRVYAGYAGWGPGQLEGELEDEGWIVVEHPLADELFSPGPDGLWHDVLERQGGQLALVARMPLDPSLNWNVGGPASGAMDSSLPVHRWSGLPPSRPLRRRASARELADRRGERVELEPLRLGDLAAREPSSRGGPRGDEAVHALDLVVRCSRRSSRRGPSRARGRAPRASRGARRRRRLAGVGVPAGDVPAAAIPVGVTDEQHPVSVAEDALHAVDVGPQRRPGELRDAVGDAVADRAPAAPGAGAATSSTARPDAPRCVSTYSPAVRSTADARARTAHRRPRTPDRRRPDLGHRPLQLPLPVLHARRGPAVARARRRPVASRRSSALVALLARWASTRCGSPAASRSCARDFPRARGDARARPGRRRPRRHDERLPAGARRRGARRRGRAPLQRLDRLAASATASSQMTRRDALPQVLRGLERSPPTPQAHPIKVNAVAHARLHRGRGAAVRRASPASIPTRCASSSSCRWTPTTRGRRPGAHRRRDPRD